MPPRPSSLRWAVLGRQCMNASGRQPPAARRRGCSWTTAAGPRRRACISSVPHWCPEYEPVPRARAPPRAARWRRRCVPTCWRLATRPAATCSAGRAGRRWTTRTRRWRPWWALSPTRSASPPAAPRPTRGARRDAGRRRGWLAALAGQPAGSRAQRCGRADARQSTLTPPQGHLGRGGGGAHGARPWLHAARRHLGHRAPGGAGDSGGAGGAGPAVVHGGAGDGRRPGAGGGCGGGLHRLHRAAHRHAL